MILNEAVGQALESVRNIVAKADGEEAEVLQAFSDEFSAEVEGWDMRLAQMDMADIQASKPSEYVPPTFVEDRNCLSWWLPRIQGAGLPVPKTHIIVTAVELIRMDDGKTPSGIERFCTRLREAADDLGYPAFLRTGQCSGKHNWEECCFLAKPDRIMQHVFNLVEWSTLADMIGLPTHVWAVREYLPVEPLYRCRAYGNMPVVPEWRVFVDGGDAKYVAPYWPKEALRRGRPDRADWEASYHAELDLPSVAVDDVCGLASEAGTACGGRWSVDVLRAGGTWYVTDMAEAERSWGYDEERF